MFSIEQTYKRTIESACSGAEKELRLKQFSEATAKDKTLLLEAARREMRVSGKMMTK